MKALGLVGARAPTGFPSSFHEPNHNRFRNNPFCVSSSSSSKTVQEQVNTVVLKSEYKPGVFDDLFLNLFRNKLVQEVGWDSQKPGYDGLIEVVNRLMMKGKTNSDTIEAAVRVLRALFPPFLLELYKMLIAPLGRGKIAAMMVFVERCKYLEESKCVGICINTCKFPTQTFFKDHMGVPLLMEPNFADYSCQFKFGVLAPPHEDDSVLKEPCLEICPNAAKRRTVTRNIDITVCPKT